jgi:hypothetical protein
MSVQSTIAVPARPRRTWLLAGVAALAACVAGISLAVTLGGGSSGGTPVQASPVETHIPSTMSVIMGLTPARLAAGALGTGYALPAAQKGPTLKSVLASMSPETRRYTQAVTSLTFAQLKAGAAGSP